MIRFTVKWTIIGLSSEINKFLIYVMKGGAYKHWNLNLLLLVKIVFKRDICDSYLLKIIPVKYPFDETNSFSTFSIISGITSEIVAQILALRPLIVSGLHLSPTTSLRL